MPKEFLKSLLWAIALHAGILGILVFSWPYLAQSVFSFDQYRIFKVSLVSLERFSQSAQRATRRLDQPIRSENPGNPVALFHPESSKSAGNFPQEEKPNNLVEDKIEKGETSTLFSLQLVRNEHPSEFQGKGQDPSSGSGKQGQVSLSASKGNAAAAGMAVPRYGQNHHPHYPTMAKEQGWQGTALLKVLVLKNGSVGSLEVLHSSGFSILDQSAMKGVKEWKFVPGQKDGQPIEMWVQIPITFRLE